MNKLLSHSTTKVLSFKYYLQQTIDVAFMGISHECQTQGFDKPSTLAFLTIGHVTCDTKNMNNSHGVNSVNFSEYLEVWNM